jgi:hypothetical protein
MAAAFFMFNKGLISLLLSVHQVHCALWTVSVEITKARHDNQFELAHDDSHGGHGYN